MENRLCCGVSNIMFRCTCIIILAIVLCLKVRVNDNRQHESVSKDFMTSPRKYAYDMVLLGLEYK